MIALIVIGAIWFLIFVIVALVFTGETGISSMISSVWFLVMSLPGFIMMFSGIVGKALSSKLEDIKSKSEKIKKTLSEMTDEELRAQRKEMMK